MANLYFYYSAMNAGKTSLLLQSDFNYKERGLRTLCFLPDSMSVDGKHDIVSRIGLSLSAHLIHPTSCLDTIIEDDLLNNGPLACVLIDEAQFLTKEQVKQLCFVVDTLTIPVLTYGLRTDFQGNLFEGSQFLLALADHLIEVKTVCFCGKKAIMNARVKEDGKAVQDGPQLLEKTQNVTYVSLCRRHYMDLLNQT